MSRLRSWLAHLFAREGFRGPVLTLLSGSTAALLIAYAALPVLTRLYTPEAFGVSDYFVTLLSLLLTCSSLRYEDALMLPENEREAASLFWLSLLLTLGLVVLLCPLVYWREAVTARLGVEALAPWLWLVPPTLLFMRLTKLGELWLTRTRQFRPISAAQVANTTSMVALRLGAGAPPLQAGAGGLIGGFFGAHVVSSALYGWFLLRAHAGPLRAAARLTPMRRLALRYRRFPLFSTPSALLNNLVARLPVLLLPLFFDLSTVGLYGRAFVALAVPLGLLGSAVSNVFFVHAAEARRTHTLPALTRTVHARLVALGLFPTLVLLLAGPDLFTFVFGEAWRPAGHYVRYIGLWLFLAGVASPLTRLFDVLERQRTDLAASLLLFTIQATALLAGGLTGDLLLTLLLLGAAGVLGRTLHLAILLRLAGVRPGAALYPYARYLCFSLPFLALVAGLMTLDRPWLTTLAAATAGVGFAALVAWREELLRARRET